MSIAEPHGHVTHQKLKKVEKTEMETRSGHLNSTFKTLEQVCETSERCQCCSIAFIVNFESVSHIVLVVPLLTLKR